MTSKSKNIEADGFDTFPIPPIVIIHLIRHAASEKISEGIPNFDAPLSHRGERQCDDLAHAMAPHVPYITHILTSPMARCVQTARKGLATIIRNGVKLTIMPPLAGRNGKVTWAMKEDQNDEELAGPWVRQDSGPRNKKILDSEFVREWLSLRDFPKNEAKNVREVVIVTQGRLLQALFGNAYRSTEFPNAVMNSYFVSTHDAEGTLRPLPYLGVTLTSQRKQQSDWLKQIKIDIEAREKQASTKISETSSAVSSAKNKHPISKELKFSGFDDKASTNERIPRLAKQNSVVKAIRIDAAILQHSGKKLGTAVDPIQTKVSRDKITAEIITNKVTGLQKIPTELDEQKVVDPETKEIMSLQDFMALLKIRHREEFLLQQKQKEEENGRERKIAPLKRKATPLVDSSMPALRPRRSLRLKRR